MKTLIVGATGATGRLLVEQLLDRGEQVKAIVRSPKNLANFQDNANLTIITANLLELSDAELQKHVLDCDAVASCLGHNISFKGLFGAPRKLVTDAVRRLSLAIHKNSPERAVKYVLMNTTGNRNRDLDEKISLGHHLVLVLLRLLLPPHVDNEKAADYLRKQIGQDNPTIEWAAVRPDGLIDAETVTDYKIYASPIRDAIFDAGQTSRINVAHFMAELITNPKTWQQWQGRMPVIYNVESIDKKA